MGRAEAPLAGEVHDAVQPSPGSPRNLLISLSDDLMCVVEIDEVSLERAGQRAIRLKRSDRADVDGEVLTTRVPGKRKRVISDGTGEFDRIDFSFALTGPAWSAAPMTRRLR